MEGGACYCTSSHHPIARGYAKGFGTYAGASVLGYGLQAHGCVGRATVVTTTACLSMLHLEKIITLMPVNTVRITTRHIPHDTQRLDSVQAGEMADLWLA